jgi:hypothetical protein
LKFGPEEIWESIRLEKLIEKHVTEIIESYGMKAQETPKFRAAIRQAVWVGMCEGKGWIDNE